MGHCFGRSLPRLLAVTVLAGAAMGQAPQTDPLTRARRAYNAGQYDTAISAAREAMKDGDRVNQANLVLGRALLDRYRATAMSADLEAARETLGAVQPSGLTPRDHVDFLIGLGLLLYHDGCDDGCFNAAAEFFGQALDRVTAPALGDRDAIFEWWAGSLDRHVLYSQDVDRVGTYRRILDRAQHELAEHSPSTSAAYWMAAAAEGAGDLDRAWSSAMSGWIAAQFHGSRGTKLRADLDYLVTQVILPSRAKVQAAEADARPLLAVLLKQWETFKAKYR